MTILPSAGPGHRVLDPMLALGHCAKHHRIVTAGSRAIELSLELHRRGYSRSAATANCGRPAEQYDIALVDWRQRTFKALEIALDWLPRLLKAEGVIVVWTDPQKEGARANMRRLLEDRGFSIKDGVIHPYGCAIAAQRKDVKPFSKAA